METPGTPPYTAYTTGERILVMRRRRGWSQDELATQSGISNASVSRYETGLDEPGARAIRALALALEVRADYLLGLSDVADVPESDRATRVWSNGEAASPVA